MNQPAATPYSTVLFYRLTALWVLNEAILGGIIHGFQIPVSGFIVGSGAVICISLIAWYAPAKGMILKATLIVAICKMMLSPQAPLPAYFAVFFQGLLGELIFHKRKLYRISCIAFGTLALLESGVQRILVLTIIYGNGLWKVLNEFFGKLTGQTSLTDYSFFIIACYLLAHITAGALIGVWAGAIPMRVKLMQPVREQYPLKLNTPEKTGLIKRKPRWRIVLLIILVILLFLLCQSYFNRGRPWLPASVPLHILLRSFLIILGWLVVVSPLLGMLLKKWLTKKQQERQSDIQAVLILLPQTQTLMQKAWQSASGSRYFSRLRLWARIILAYTFTDPDAIP